MTHGPNPTATCFENKVVLELSHTICLHIVCGRFHCKSSME